MSIFSKNKSKNTVNLSPDINAIPTENSGSGGDEITNFVGQGVVSVIDMLSPSSIDTRQPDCIIVDNMYITTLLVITYPYERTAGWLSDIISHDEGVEVNMYYEPLDKSKVIKELTYMIASTGAKRKSIGENQSDVDIIDTSIGHARYMRAQMQLDSEDPYHLYILISVYADSKEKLDDKLRSIEGKLGSLDIMSRRADFRHENGFLACLPIHQLAPELKKSTRRNSLTSGTASTYPFVSSEFCDNDGIFFGINEHNRSLVIVDIFNSKVYKNANMVVLGTSGAGKTFTLQLIAMRNRLQGISVMIIAPLKGHEFKNSCLAVGGEYVKIAPGSSHCINIMEIRKSSLEGEAQDQDEGSGSKQETSLLLNKIQKLHIFFSLLFVDMTIEEKQYLDDKLIETYKLKGISFENESVFSNAPPDPITNERSFKTMPVLGDLYDIMEKDPHTQRLALILKRMVHGSLKSFNQHTNIDLKNKYIVADISELKDDLLPLGMFITVDLFWDKIKEDRAHKKIIIVDEAWNLIGSTGNRQTAGFVLEIFKIIRGYGGAAIAATQDINDFLALEGGKYGKGIINNSKMKIVLQLEDEDAQVLQKVLKLSEEEMAKVTTFKRGHALFYAGNNHVALEFVPSQEEREMITTDRAEVAEIRARKKAGMAANEHEKHEDFFEEDDEDENEDFDETDEFFN